MSSKVQPAAQKGKAINTRAVLPKRARLSSPVLGGSPSHGEENAQDSKRRRPAFHVTQKTDEVSARQPSQLEHKILVEDEEDALQWFSRRPGTNPLQCTAAGGFYVTNSTSARGSDSLRPISFAATMRGVEEGAEKCLSQLDRWEDLRCNSITCLEKDPASSDDAALDIKDKIRDSLANLHANVAEGEEYPETGNHVQIWDMKSILKDIESIEGMLKEVSECESLEPRSILKKQWPEDSVRDLKDLMTRVPQLQLGQNETPLLRRAFMEDMDDPDSEEAQRWEVTICPVTGSINTRTVDVDADGRTSVRGGECPDCSHFSGSMTQGHPRTHDRESFINSSLPTRSKDGDSRAG